MFKFKGVLPFALLMLILVSDRVNAEIWELGYTKPVVEELNDEDAIESLPTENSEIAETEKSPKTVEAKVATEDLSSSKSSARNFTRISTSKNTFGVETVEQQKSSIYVAPFFGFASVLGNGTVDVNPQYSFGGRIGYLLLDNLMIEGGYSRNWMMTSAPISTSIGYQAPNVFDYRQRTMDLGGKLFFLGRESRLRPFIYGGFAMTNATLNYATNYQALSAVTGDFEISQLQGAGQLGLEFAFTRRIVATATFQLNGVLSHKATAPTANGGVVNLLESSRITAGNSLSHSATYAGSLGLGVYF